MRRLPLRFTLFDSFTPPSPSQSRTSGRLLTKLLASAFIILFTVSLTCGQIANVGNDTSTPVPGSGHDYLKFLNETVNPANGSVSG